MPQGKYQVALDTLDSAAGGALASNKRDYELYKVRCLDVQTVDRVGFAVSSCIIDSAYSPF